MGFLSDNILSIQIWQTQLKWRYGWNFGAGQIKWFSYCFGGEGAVHQLMSVLLPSLPLFHATAFIFRAPITLSKPAELHEECRSQLRKVPGQCHILSCGSPMLKLATAPCAWNVFGCYIGCNVCVVLFALCCEPMGNLFPACSTPGLPSHGAAFLLSDIYCKLSEEH